METKILAGKEWLQELGSNVGKVGLLVAPQQGLTGLRKPYQFEIPAQLFFRMSKVINNIETFKLCQHGGVMTKPTKYGSRFEVWVLGYATGFLEGDGGVTELEWNALVKRITGILTEVLGESVKPYAEAWTAERKFQFRFETYIQFKELA